MARDLRVQLRVHLQFISGGQIVHAHLRLAVGFRDHGLGTSLLLRVGDLGQSPVAIDRHMHASVVDL